MTKELFNEIVRLWYDPLYRFAYSLCHNPDDALDLTQDAFQKLARKSDSIRDGNKIKSWLFSVLHREFIDIYRHERRFPKTSLELVTLPQDPDAASPGEGLDAAEALRCLQQLDPRFRAPLVLYYLKSFSYKEIAETLEIPIGTVMSRLRRAKDQLRALLDAENEFVPSAEATPLLRKVSHG